jgi:hypothetical protein
MGRTCDHLRLGFLLSGTQIWQRGRGDGGGGRVVEHGGGGGVQGWCGLRDAAAVAPSRRVVGGLTQVVAAGPIIEVRV